MTDAPENRNSANCGDAARSRRKICVGKRVGRLAKFQMIRLLAGKYGLHFLRSARARRGNGSRVPVYCLAQLSAYCGEASSMMEV